MAGLLDWLTEGIGGAMGGGGGMGDISSPPPPAPAPAPPAQSDGGGAPPLAPDSASAAQTAGMPPPPVGMTPSSVPAPLASPPIMARPPEPPAGGPSFPTQGSDAPLGAPEANKIYDSYKAAGGGGPVQIAGSPGNPVSGQPNGFVPPPTGPSWAPDQQGRGGILSQALGMSPDQSNRLAASLGAGFTAAGNSAGKSPFQALSSGAGATLEGGTKEQHANTKDALSYLDKAMTEKKNGNEAAYNTNMMQYHMAKLKSEQEAAASATAANKNDSPTQLYLAAQRNVAADPMVRGAMESYKNALKNGSPQEQAAAKAILDQTTNERQAAHLAGVGLHPQTAAEVAKQPGMTQANPVDAGTAGITAANIGQKLQPGQFYKNPADGKVYQFKGAPTKDGLYRGVSSVTKPKSADPLKPSRGASAPASAEDDE